MRHPPFAHGCERPLQVWGNDKVIGVLAGHFSDPRSGLALHTLHPFEAVGAGDAMLIPLLADHDKGETCMIHLFGRGGRWLFYGHDTGFPPEATWAYLASWAAQHHRLDVALLDCTNGPGAGRNGHMGLPAAAEVRERLLHLGAAGPHTRFVVTHFSHNGGLLHEELVERAAPLGLEVAYDGMEIAVE
jgi:phosphoribosyl 1,2-cyclic phosphate phosphodiesterase